MTQPLPRYADIIGQEDSIYRLAVFSEFYLKNGSTPEHVLIVAEEGMGKRTIATACVNELQVPWQEINASQLQIKGDLTAILTNLRERQALIIYDVHKLKPTLRDVLLEPLRTNQVTIAIGERLHVMKVKPFTMLGTAPKKSECPDELLRLLLFAPLFSSFRFLRLTYQSAPKNPWATPTNLPSPK